MENKGYVVDANVFLEYIYERPLKTHSKKLLQDAIVQRIHILIPSLLLDEVTEVLCGNLENLDTIKIHLQFLETLVKKDVLHVIVPDTEVRMKAIDIARTGNSKSGYPEFTDSLYHALAILNGAIFITNDRKHIRKVKRFGHIEELCKYHDFSESST